MTPVEVGVAVGLGLVGVGLGRLTARELAIGGYRIPEDEATGPAGSRWWPPVALAVIWASLALALGDLAGWAALPTYLLFGWLSVALVWIDLDVHRLPNGLVLPAYPATAVLLAIASVADGGRHWVDALVGGGALFVLFWILSILPGGGMGAGDVKLAGLMGALLAWLDVGYLFVGVMLTFLLGGVMAVVLLLTGRAGRKTRFAFGPAMCAGTLLSVVFAPAIARALAS